MAFSSSAMNSLMTESARRFPPPGRSRNKLFSPPYRLPWNQNRHYAFNKEFYACALCGSWKTGAAFYLNPDLHSHLGTAALSRLC